jgi:hypothetical protein
MAAEAFSSVTSPEIFISIGVGQMAVRAVKKPHSCELLRRPRTGLRRSGQATSNHLSAFNSPRPSISSGVSVRSLAETGIESELHAVGRCSKFSHLPHTGFVRTNVPLFLGMFSTSPRVLLLLITPRHWWLKSNCFKQVGVLFVQLSAFGVFRTLPRFGLSFDRRYFSQLIAVRV